MIKLTFKPLGPSDTYVQLPGYQPSMGTHGMILRYFCTISPLLFMRMSVLYGAFFGCSSCRSPVSENTPHTLALRQAAAKISVSSPGTAEAVSYISLESYMIPWVLYSGKITRSMPGSPTFIPTSISPILRALSRTSFLVCIRGILQLTTATPTVSLLLEISPCNMLNLLGCTAR